MLKEQERLLALVQKQNAKNRRLEEHLASGIGLDKLKRGERARDPLYDPLDDLSFDEEEQLEEFDRQLEAERKNKKKKKAHAQ